MDSVSSMHMAHRVCCCSITFASLAFLTGCSSDVNIRATPEPHERTRREGQASPAEGEQSAEMPSAEEHTADKSALPATDVSPSTGPIENVPPQGSDWFVDATESSGIDFVHFNGAGGEYTLAEITGAGGAFFDYDNDGDMDLYLVQGAPLRKNQAPPDDKVRLGNRLFRNDTAGSVKFTDVTATSGAGVSGYGMGVATGDFDADGWVDLYVTNLGPNYLLRNNGDGSFTDVTQSSGTDDARWSTSASFLDIDNDGWLDLFVAHYVDFSIDMKRRCYSSSSARDYCGPDSYDAISDRLFRNRGDGTFEDITDRAGISRVKAAGLGVVAADLNGDGWTDIYVANDGDANHLWLNQQGRGTFEEAALLAGVAINRMGTAEASMGVDVADIDADGDVDLFMTHLERESNTLYRNLGDGTFEDRTIEFGLHAPSLMYTSFGTRFFDYDNDGDLDLLAVNGAVRVIESLARNGDAYPLHQRNQLFRNQGDGSYEEVTHIAGAVLADSRVSRGLALADVDNDGDTDFLVCNNNGPAQLLLNQIGNQNSWLGLRLLDGNCDVLQARIEVIDKDKISRWRHIHTDGSFCSASDPRVIVGLSTSERSPIVNVYWPGGAVQQLTELPLNQYTTLHGPLPANKTINNPNR